MKNWPLKKRLLVARIGIGSIMLLLLVFWLYSLKISMNLERNNSEQPLLDIQKIKQDVSDSLKDLEKGSKLLKKINTTTVEATTSPEMEQLKQENRLKLDQLRQQLEEISNQSSDK